MKRKLSASIDVEVPFHDLDPVEIAWHGHYPKYLAVARDALMQAIGYSHLEMRATGYAWVMVEMNLRYLAPARLSDRLRVTATLLEYDPLLKIAYRIVDAASGRRLTRGLTVQAPVTLADGTLVQAIPEVFRKPIECALRAVAR